MLENIGSDVDVQRLMHEIRASVTSQPQTAQKNSSDSSRPPESNLIPATSYHVNDLLKFHGEDFVRNAYRALLGREADDLGLRHHSDALSSGYFNKMDVLASLLSSPEGQGSKIKLEGLRLPVTVRRLGRIPIVGYFIRLLIAVARLPNLVRYQSQFEFYSWAQQKRIMDHQTQAYKELNESVNQVSTLLLESMQRSTLEYHEKVTAQVQELEGMMAVRLRDIRNDVDQSTMKLREDLSALSQRVDDQKQLFIQQEAETQQLLSQLDRRTQDELRPIVTRQEKTDLQFLTHERSLALLLEQVRQNAAQTSPTLARVATTEAEHLNDALYASFEDRFRGPRDEVRERLKVYVPILKEASITGGVLDVGCGRGEWQELLNSEGIEAVGVDNNRVFVEQCRRASLNVVEEDALIHLRSLPDESLNAVTTFHLIEHLSFEKLIELLNEIVRILKPGGIVIVETPNPENFMVGSCSFYADPTHRNPIPSQTLQFLLESRGLGDIKVMKLRPRDEVKIEGDSELIKRFNEYFYSAPDYGIVARKPGLSRPAATDVQ